MSTTIDSVNRKVSLGGGIGDSCGAYYSFDAPDANVIGMRVAFRPYFDSFLDTTISPFTRTVYSGSGYNIYTNAYASAVWDDNFFLGFSFGTTFPVKGSGQKGLLGVKKVEQTTNSIGLSYRTDWVLGNVSKWVTLGTNLGTGADYAGGSHPGSGYLVRSPKATTSPSTDNETLGGGFSYISPYSPNATTVPFYFPADATEGEKYTFGYDLRRGVGSDHASYLRWYTNTNSLVEADFLDVFSSADTISGANLVSTTGAGNTSPDSGDAFWESSNWLPPPYFMCRYGLPSQFFRIHGLRYQYIYA